MKNVDSSATPDLAALIRSGGPARRSRRLLLLAGAAVLLLALLALWLGQRSADRNRPAPFVTESLRRGDINLTITATGNLAPTNSITVGSELSGTVLEVYVDANDHVAKGQPLAKLDTTKLLQTAASSRATVASARAKVAEAEATVREDRATLARQEELNRLSGGKSPSRSELETSRATVDRAVASLASAQADLTQAQAQLEVAETDVGKAVIKSPIDGIVLTRSIEPGQTVAASFTAPELFVIAEKLERMKLDVTVAEADIARVARGQVARFTVDAWPDRTYSAGVVKVAYGSTTSNNVVTYQTELSVANDDLTLRPGMTATADIRVAERSQVYLVSNSALRFDPATALPAPGGAAAPKKSFLQSVIPMPPRMSKRPDGGAAAETPAATPGTARLWVLRDGQPEPIEVKTGLNDGRHTEVSSDALTADLPVIVRANLPSS